MGGEWGICALSRQLALSGVCVLGVCRSPFFSWLPTKPLRKGGVNTCLQIPAPHPSHVGSGLGNFEWMVQRRNSKGVQYFGDAICVRILVWVSWVSAFIKYISGDRNALARLSFSRTPVRRCSSLSGSRKLKLRTSPRTSDRARVIR